jgi:hypothetical protein
LSYFGNGFRARLLEKHNANVHTRQEISALKEVSNNIRNSIILRQIIAGITISTRKSGEIAIWSHHKKSEEMRLVFYSSI